MSQIGNILVRNISEINKSMLIEFQKESEFPSLNSYLLHVIDSHIENKLTGNLKLGMIKHEKELINAVKENTEAITKLLKQLYED